MGIAAFRFKGWSISGNRPLELEDISPWLFQEAVEDRRIVRLGLGERRYRTPDDPIDLPHFSTWGMAVIKIIAEREFLRQTG
jgi:hypothetical protein